MTDRFDPYSHILSEPSISLFVAGCAAVGVAVTAWSVHDILHIQERDESAKGKKRDIILCLFAGSIGTCTATIFSTSLVSLIPRIDFDVQTVFFATLFQVFCLPVVAVVQFAIYRLCTWRNFGRRARMICAVAPVIVIGVGMMGFSVFWSLPTMRFRQVFGMSPPSSVRNIRYDCHTLGFGTFIAISLEGDSADIVFLENRIRDSQVRREWEPYLERFDVETNPEKTRLKVTASGD